MAKVGGRGGAIHVNGLASLQRDLRATAAELPRELRKGLKEVAEIVASDARVKALSAGGVIAEVAPSIRAAAEQRAAKVAWGGAKYPFAGGALMGAYHDIPRQTSRGTVIGWNQFPEWVGNDWEFASRDDGPYAIAPAISDTDREVLEALGDFLDSVIDDHLGRTSNSIDITSTIG